jgi:hypothetical protein
MNNKKIIGNPVGVPNPKVDISLYDTKDAVNLKLYGTTDVHILTDDDVWINSGILEAQKRSIIESDVVIIPYGVRAIIPREAFWDGELGDYVWEDGVYPINIRAKKIICPSTLVNIQGTTGFFDSRDIFLNDIKISGDFVLNEGVKIINLANSELMMSSEIGNIVIPKTLEIFTVWGYSYDIVIPNNVDKFSFWSADRLNCHLYVYNPDFDFSDFETGVVSEIGGDGVIHGYAGSTAEAFAKDNGYTFVNLGSSGGGADMETIKQYVDEQIGLALEGDY